MDHVFLRGTAGLFGDQAVSTGRNGDPSREEPGAATVSQGDAGNEGLRRWKVSCPQTRPLRYAAAGGAGPDRDHRCAICRGFNPRCARDHSRRIHRVYVERLRHSRAALDVLRVGWNDGPVPLSPLWVVGGAGFCRTKDDRRALFPHPDDLDAGCHCARAGNVDSGFSETSQEEGSLEKLSANFLTTGDMEVTEELRTDRRLG